MKRVTVNILYTIFNADRLSVALLETLTYLPSYFYAMAKRHHIHLIRICKKIIFIMHHRHYMARFISQSSLSAVSTYEYKMSCTRPFVHQGHCNQTLHHQSVQLVQHSLIQILNQVFDVHYCHCTDTYRLQSSLLLY
jgi:hypothetical protein